MTYLEMVNKVLVRLRESKVDTVDETPYSSLIGEFINVIKRDVEDAYNWPQLRTNYQSGQDFTLFPRDRTEILSVYITQVNYSNGDTEYVYWPLKEITQTKYNELVSKHRADKGFGAPVTEHPCYWFFGYNTNPPKDPSFFLGGTTIGLWPFKRSDVLSYSLYVDVKQPQPDLTADNDAPMTDPQTIIEGAIWMAYDERGSDDDIDKQEQVYLRRLANIISLSHNDTMGTTWQAV